jgi:hypothetical protein
MFFIATLGAVFVAPPAQATAISVVESGVIASYSQGDTLNLFGGGSLAGDAVSIAFNYNTGSCGYVSSTYVTQCGSSITASISITAGGVPYTYSLTSAATSASSFAESGSTYAFYWDQGGTGAIVNLLEFDLFGTTPTDVSSGPIANLDPSHYQQLAVCTTNNGSSCDILDANFNATPAAAPEPSSMAILGVGLLALWRVRGRGACLA